MEDLEVKYEIQNHINNKEDAGVWLRMVLTNNSTNDYWILKRDTPLEESSGRPYLEVYKDGFQLPYDGKISKRRAISEEDFILIAPSETIEGRQNIANDYFLSEVGIYEVNLNNIVIRNSRNVENIASKRLFVAQPENAAITFEIEEGAGKLLSLGEKSRRDFYSRKKKSQTNITPSLASPTYTKCTPNKQSIINLAHKQAYDLINRSITRLINNQTTTKVLYKEWFGKYSANRFKLVLDNYNKIKNKQAVQTINYHCSGPSCDPGDYAYVFKGVNDWTIYLCSEFWNAPNTGFNSKAGVIIHELSHLAALTDDFKYGPTNCRNLAKTNPSNAIKNADNYEYYSES